MILYIAFAVFAIVLLGVVIWYFTRDSKKSTKPPTNNDVTKNVLDTVKSVSNDIKSITEETFQNPTKGKSKLKKKKKNSESNVFDEYTIEEIFEILEKATLLQLDSEIQESKNMQFSNQKSNDELIGDFEKLIKTLAQISYFYNTTIINVYDAIIEAASKRDDINIPDIESRWGKIVQEIANRMNVWVVFVYSNINKIKNIINAKSDAFSSFGKWMHDRELSNLSSNAPAIRITAKRRNPTPSSPPPMASYGPTPSPSQPMPMSGYTPSPVPRPAL